MLKIRKMLKNNQGFTLVELLVVLVIIGILAALAIPRVAGMVKDAKIDACNANVEIIQRAVEIQYAKNGKYISLDDLITKNYIKEKPKCPVNGSDYTLSKTKDENDTATPHTGADHTKTN